MLHARWGQVKPCQPIWEDYIFVYLPSPAEIGMLDGLTLDQLRTFIAAAETVSFLPSWRSLCRAQSEELKSEPLVEVPFVTVVSPSHPLAGKRGVIPTAALAKEVQLVLSDRTTLTEGRNYGVFSPLTWRLADLGAKLAFLKSGLGWGHMPLHMVQADLDRRALVKIRVEGAPRDFVMPMRIIYRKDAPPGPAGRTFIDH